MTSGPRTSVRLLFPAVLYARQALVKAALYGVEQRADIGGDCYDNTLAETINGLVKAEIIHWRAPRLACMMPGFQRQLPPA